MIIDGGSNNNIVFKKYGVIKDGHKFETEEAKTATSISYFLGTK